MGRARLPFRQSLQNAKKSRAASFARMQWRGKNLSILRKKTV